jgi:hypothetical protein
MRNKYLRDPKAGQTDMTFQSMPIGTCDYDLIVIVQASSTISRCVP